MSSLSNILLMVRELKSHREVGFRTYFPLFEVNPFLIPACVSLLILCSLRTFLHSELHAVARPAPIKCLLQTLHILLVDFISFLDLSTSAISALLLPAKILAHL